MISSKRKVLQAKNVFTPVRSDDKNRIMKKKSSSKFVTPNLRDCSDSCSSFSNEDRIKVYLRVRPLLQSERSINYHINKDTISVRPHGMCSSSFCVDKSFTFRHIFDGHSTQDDVFETVALPLLPEFFNGKDVLIFCYGSTNAGKTYTVSGTPNNNGILQKSLEFIVKKIHEQYRNHSVELYASFYEIYNERIFDLLDINKNKTTTLQLGINKYGETQVKGATEILIKSLDDAASVVAKAEAGRHRGANELNCDSSRSHTIFQLQLRRKNHSTIFSVVDLAGSERLSSINSTKGSFQEACNINKSMLVLGKCIRKLKEQSMGNNCNIEGTSCKIQQIPYRESKLTYLFKTFFEPKLRPSKAAMIINISPSDIQTDDTIFALQFAAEASQCAIRQVDMNNAYFTDFEDISLDSLESKIEARIRLEMEAFLERKENEFKERINQVNALGNCSLLDPSSSSFLFDSSIHFDVNDELSDMKRRNAVITNENIQLISAIQYNQEEILKSHKKIKSLNRKILNMKSTLTALQQKNNLLGYQLLSSMNQ